MFGRGTYTSKPQTLHEATPSRTISIEEVLSYTKTPELGTVEPYHESYFWWTNPEKIVTLEDIAALYRYQHG